MIKIFKSIYGKIAAALFILGCFSAWNANVAFAKNDFVVVIDPGHGGRDHGAIDNDAREKDINLAVATRLGELIEKKMKDTDVVFTRDDDTFISLQGRADVANKAKGNLFISIHTNSVDAKNKNRANVAGASVYTLGNHKDDANMGVARRENAVIELENGYQQKYSGFDPNKDESYIIFEMAQKNNVSQSNRFAKMVQQNLVKIAGRKDRGVHQAGFWVLWSTSMPSVLIELDFICNPESAKFMTSKEGVDKLADAIFQAVKIYEQNYRQSQRMASERKSRTTSDGEDKSLASKSGSVKSAKTGNNNEDKQSRDSSSNVQPMASESTGISAGTTLAVAYVPESDARDMSHSHLLTTKEQKKPRTTADGRRRRSAKSRKASAMRNVEGEIKLYTEFTGKTEVAKEETRVMASAKSEQASPEKNGKKGKKDKKKSSKKISTKKTADKKTADKSNAGKGEPSAAMKAKARMAKEEKERKRREKEERELAKREKKQKELQAKEMAKATRKNTSKEGQSKALAKDSRQDASSQSVKPTDPVKASASSNTSTDKKNIALGKQKEQESSITHAGKRKSLRSRGAN